MTQCHVHQTAHFLFISCKFGVNFDAIQAVLSHVKLNATSGAPAKQSGLSASLRMLEVHAQGLLQIQKDLTLDSQTCHTDKQPARGTSRLPDRRPPGFKKNFLFSPVWRSLLSRYISTLHRPAPRGVTWLTSGPHDDYRSVDSDGTQLTGRLSGSYRRKLSVAHTEPQRCPYHFISSPSSIHTNDHNNNNTDNNNNDNINCFVS